jgi:putative MATE family efflux protein
MNEICAAETLAGKKQQPKPDSRLVRLTFGRRNKVTESKEIKTRSDMLANERIGKLLWKLSVPAIIGMVVQGLYNIVDTFFVGRFVGSLGIGGTAIAFPIQMIIVGIGMTIGVGGASLLSRNMGAKNHEEASLVLGNMIMLSIITGVASTIGGIVALEPILRFFGANDALMPYSKSFIAIILLGSPFITFSVVASSAARAEGNAKVAMNMMLIGAIINAALNPIFILVFGLGVRGSAIATVISLIASCIFLLRYLLSGKSEIALNLRHLRLKRSIIRETFAVGASDFARTAAMSLTTAIFNNILSRLGGELAIATFGIIFRVISFVFMPMIGIAQGAQPILGFNFGARQFHRIKQSFSFATRSATAIAMVGFVIFLLFPAPILGIFSTDGNLIAMGARATRWLVLGLPLVGYQNIGTSLFQAIGKSKPAIFLAFTRQVLFLIPIVILFSHFFGLQGVWLSFPITDVVSFIVTYFMVARELRILDRVLGQKQFEGLPPQPAMEIQTHP